MKKTAGYTLIEVAVAAAILVLILAGAAAMSLTIVTQEESNTRIARALNYQEQIARLFQLGLSPSAARALVPEEPGVEIAFPDPEIETAEVSGGVTLEKTVLTMTSHPTSAARVHAPMQVYRPSIR